MILILPVRSEEHTITDSRDLFNTLHNFDGQFEFLDN